MKNQCDGCARGLPIEKGIHKGENFDWMGCSKHMYEGEKMKTVSADMRIELNVTCDCGHYFDLFEIERLNEEGQLIKAACPDGIWHDEHKKFKANVECPECNETISVSRINW